MRALKAKLNSRRGASLLLALLFFLIALLVGASILMAAASNAGKAKSNRDEQQAYLTLSSALQLVVDDITGGAYTGKYRYTRGGNQGNRRYYYTQQKGECTSQFLEPFLPVMEQEFSGKCAPQVQDFGNRYTWTPLNTTGAVTETTVTLQVSGGPEYQAITAETVKVKLTMGSNFTIQATATITEGNFKDYSMEADFVLDGNFDITVDRFSDGTTRDRTADFKWKLGKMVKGWAS